MKIFISHSSKEKHLADAWQELLKRLEPSIETWHSNDEDPDGGMDAGNWRNQIEQELQQTDLVLAIFTPESKGKPWIYFESAYVLGMGENKNVIPVLYDMEKEELLSPLQDMYKCKGDSNNEMVNLCNQLVTKSNGKPVNQELLDMALTKYFCEVEEHKLERMGESLFHGHFHNHQAAQKLEGTWFARWAQLIGDEETVFETHPLKVWTTQSRIRITGRGKKDATSDYPMEGVVSSSGYVALTYWSQDEIPICGTALLKLIGGNRIMTGTWQGITAATLKEELQLMAGKVIIARDESDLT
jgi:hypothetical protein